MYLHVVIAMRSRHPLSILFSPVIASYCLQKRHEEIEYCGEKAMVSICYEVFPVTIVSMQPVLLRRTQERERGPWLLSSQSKHHPNHVVIAHLLNAFGDSYDLRRAIVHSTSWR